MGVAPVVTAAAVALAAAAVGGPTPPTPHQLAVALTADAQRVATAVSTSGSDFVNQVASADATVTGLLAQSPSVLAHSSAHDLARIAALPNATTPLQDLVGGGDAVPSVAAQQDTALSDLLGSLQTIIGRIQDAAVAAPNNVVLAVGQLLNGDVRDSLLTLSSIFTDPILFIGAFDVPGVAAALSELFPPAAPVFKALPDVVINVGVKLLQIPFDIRNAIADAYEGVRDGLLNKDIGAAANALVGSLATFAQNSFKDVSAPTVSSTICSSPGAR